MKFEELIDSQLNESFPAMFKVHEAKIEQLLYRYATGEITARQVNDQLRRLGYKMDHRTDWVHNKATLHDLRTGRTIVVEI